MNQALSSLLAGNNTTISIAHRLSTIKRSDMIICIGSDGKVAEVGTYNELSERKDGAFSKLMEWQMSGGEKNRPPQPTISEEEELEMRAEQEGEGEETIEEEGTKVRKEDVTEGEAVAERIKGGDR